MNTLKTVVFVDGQNFKKNLREYSFNSGTGLKDYQLEEKHFNWRLFFEDVLKKFNDSTKTEHRLLRAYWYNAESITPFKNNPKLAQKICSSYKGTLSINEGRICDLAKKWWEKERDYFNKTRDEVFEKIQKETDFLEFKYVGQYVVKPFELYKLEPNPDGSIFYQGKRAGEKGVDIGIATDMIAKMNFYDVAILISGDADFQPVVRYLKDHLKQVYQFSIAKGVPPTINYLSAYLRSMVDVFQYFDEEELLNKYLKLNEIPFPLHSAVKDRIAELSSQKQSP